MIHHRWGQLVRKLAGAAVALVLNGQAMGSEPPTEPFLRIETGMHTSLIRRIVVDAPRNRLITCSDDKTIRIWQMPEKRLLSTLRVPIDRGHEGQLFGLAVSPDGRTIAAGGWTGWTWEKKAYVYIFDVISGELKRRIGGFVDAIAALAWSGDGDHLVVGLHGRAGMVVVRVDDGTVVAKDAAYLDKLTDIHVANNGRIVAAGLDGMVRLYSRDFRLIGRRKSGGGAKVLAVKFSPDSQKIAVGHADVANVSVLSARDLSQMFLANTDGLVDQANFLTIVWSSDGEYLYAGGDYRGDGLTPLYRWGAKGTGPRERIPVAANRIPEIQQMPNGHIAFAAEDPGFGVVSPQGKVISFRGPDIIDFSAAHGDLRVSHDGLDIRYPFGRTSDQFHVFSALGGGAQVPSAPDGQARVSGPIQASDNFTLSNWRNSFKPVINGRIPFLADYEMARAYAIAPDHKHLLLGTEWAVRLLDTDAREIWSVDLSAVAWAVNISGNGRLAVAALSDGTVRWYRMTDGQEVLSYFPHGNGKDWIAWLPSGYYVSSIFGDNYIGWHVNRGKAQTPDFHRAVQFDRILYRPDIVKVNAQPYSEPKIRALKLANNDDQFDISRLAEIAPPRLRLSMGTVDISKGKALLNLRISAEKNSLDMKDVTVFVNSLPVTPTRDRFLTAAESQGFTRELLVPLASHINTIRVEAFNGVSMGVAETYLALPEKLTVKPVPGDLYLLAVGVNTFPKLPIDANLAYASQDARDITKALVEKGTGYFRKIFAKLINDESAQKPDRGTISAALAFIQQASPEDTVVIFLASHGISDTAGNYFFVPRDAIEGDLDRLFDGGKIESLIPWTVFFDTLRLTAGRRLLVVDTCQARNIEGKFEAHSLMKRSASSMFSLMLASKGDEESQEHPQSRHGLFTFSLLSAFSARSDTNADGLLTLHEIFNSVTTTVDKQRDTRIGPQTPQLVAPPSIGNFPLLAVGG